MMRYVEPSMDILTLDVESVVTTSDTVPKLDPVTGNIPGGDVTDWDEF